MGPGKEILEWARRADAEARIVAERARRMAILEQVAKASARYVASHRLQAVRFQLAEDKGEYEAAGIALEELLSELDKCPGVGPTPTRTE